jgi:hypothetical protein
MSKSRSSEAAGQTRLPRLDAHKYRGRWVAVDPTTQRIVGDGDSLATAEEAAQRAGFNKPLLFAVPAADSYFVGSCR